MKMWVLGSVITSADFVWVSVVSMWRSEDVNENNLRRRVREDQGWWLDSESQRTQLCVDPSGVSGWL
jgi:hypothetical protein